MKTLIKSLILTIAMLGCAAGAYAQGTAFTYQGRLTIAATNANGNYDLRFTLYDALTGGAVVAGPITNTPVAISNGIFTVTLDFGSGVFTGPRRWVEIGARSNTVAVAFTALSPRQELTPTPYAITAENLDGSLLASQLTGTLPGGLLSGTYGNALNLNNAGNSFTGNGAGLANVNAATLGGLGANSFWKTLGNAGTTAGPNYVGTTDNQALEIHVNGVRGLRVEPDPVFGTPNVIGGSPANFVTPGLVGNFIGAGGQIGFASNYVTGGNLNVIAGGWDNHITNGLLSVIGGGEFNTVGATLGTIGGGLGNTATGSYATVPGGANNLASGDYSFAAGQNALSLHAGSFVWADSSGGTFSSVFNNEFLVRSRFMGVNRNSPVTGADTFAVRSMITNGYGGMYVETSGVGWPFYGYAMNGGAYAWTYVDGGDANKWKLSYGLTVTTSGAVGIGTSDPQDAILDIQGATHINDNDIYMRAGADRNHGIGYRNSVNGISFDGPFVYGYLGGALGSAAPDAVAVKWDWQGNAWVSNNCSVATLTIRGGADLAEPFEITAANQEVSEGSVVVIDEENPGHLKLSNSSYDTHVAGVVSGANGIKPGIQLHQEGMLDGGKNVALTGRVYVKADASFGAIRPGDLLTTSETPGAAMKVTNPGKAQGAILGKAMTSLKEGKGMVLVLVTLQ